MDMLDPTLESSQEKTNDSAESDDQSQLTQAAEGTYETSEEQAAAIASVQQGTLSLDPNSVQYQFRTDTGQGQVTYRVVQVAQDGTEGQVVTAPGLPPGTQVAQAVIQSPFSNGGSPTADALGGTETRFTYVPAVSGAGDTTVQAQGAEVGTTTIGQVATADVAHATIGQVTTAGGQFYVMMSPQDVLQGQRNIAPRTTFSPKLDGPRSTRDERRRATHNEVERRRRDKINNWIVQLSKLVPDCAQEHTKGGQVSVSSKGGILAKACDYINELRTANVRMAESLKETERLSVDAELLRQQCEELKQENSVLRAQLQQHGIMPPDLAGATS